MVEEQIPSEILQLENKCGLALQDIEDIMKGTRKYALKDLGEKLRELENYAKNSKKDIRSRQNEPLDYMFHTIEEYIGNVVGESYRLYESIKSLKSSCHLFREENHLIRK